MIFELHVALTIICLILEGTITANLFRIFRRHKAAVEKAALLLLLTLFLGFLLYFINLFVQDLQIFLVLMILSPITYFFAFSGSFTLLEGGGEVRPKLEKLILYIYITVLMVIVATLSLLNIQITPGEPRYFGVDLWTLFIPMILMTLPQFYTAIISLKYYVKLYEKEIQVTHFIFMGLLTSFITSQFLIIYMTEIRPIAYYIFIGAAIGGIIFLMVRHNYMAQLASTFAYKSLFVIRNNGQTLYSHEFERIIDETKDIKTIQYLIGGFIYAISHGLKEIIKEEILDKTDLRAMDFGRLKMLFYYGNGVFGVLFTRESNNVIYDRLKRFINEFELVFKEFLESKTGPSLLEGQTLPDPAIKKIDDLLQLYFKF